MIGFVNAALNLKGVSRSGWVDAGVEGAESVADHSYATSMIAMLLSDAEGLDTERAVRMALMHDLAESVTGDITPSQMSRDQKARRERRAMEGILSGLPDRLRRKYASLWQEYIEGETPEAALVHDADRWDMVLQAGRYCGRGRADLLEGIAEYGRDRISQARADAIPEE